MKCNFAIILFLFCIATVCYWLKSREPLSQPIRSKTKTIMTGLYVFSCAWCQLHVHVFALSSDCFIVLFTTVVIGKSSYFGFGFTTLK